MSLKVVLLWAVVLTSLMSSKVFAQVELAPQNAEQASKGAEYLAKDTEYIRHAFVVDRALRRNFGVMQVSDESIPADAQSARSLFVRICEPSVQNDRYQKKLMVSKTGSITLFNFICETKDDYSTQTQMVQFVVSVDIHQSLQDLQILQTGDRGLQSGSNQSNQWSSKDAGEVLVAVAAGTLASGMLAKGLYPDQHDKILHAIAGNLIAITTGLISYYGFDVSKNQAFWIGLASGILAGILKEVYDSHHRDRHTVDAQDALATGFGGLAGAFVLRIKFSF